MPFSLSFFTFKQIQSLADICYVIKVIKNYENDDFTPNSIKVNSILDIFIMFLPFGLDLNYIR